MLYGSNSFCSSFVINGVTYTLGDVVRYAFAQSGLSHDEWNERPEVERDIALVLAIRDIKNQTAAK